MKNDTHGTGQRGWIGVDLDGTLAHYDGWKGIDHIGEPIPLMLSRVESWLAQGKEVRIFTARVSPQKGISEQIKAIVVIKSWLGKHLGLVGETLQITHEKDMGMIELWDDRCVQVIPNTGERADGK